MTMMACDRGLRGERDRGVDLLSPTVRTQRDVRACKQNCDVTESHVGAATHTHATHSCT